MNSSKNAVCPGCTLLCDDLELSGSGSRIVATNACDKGQNYFQVDLDANPVSAISGNPVEFESAIQAAAEILNRSTAPLICGLDHLTTEAQQEAWKLADCLGAAIDTTLSNQGRASMFALQRIGKVTATLGEVASRSDLIVFWFCDPAASHPRLLERLNRSPDHPRRKIIVVDESETESAKLADLFFQVDSNSAPAMLAAIRGTIAKLPLSESHVLETTGLDLDTIEEISTSLGNAKYGSIFFGQPTADSSFDISTDSIAHLVRILNSQTRFVGLKLRADGNAQSAESVLAWSSGYPFAVNHHLGFPRFNGLEHSAETMLARGECDAILLATGLDLQETFASLNRTAREHLSSIPKIALTPLADFPADVSFRVGVPGLNEAGEYCRIDDVSLPVLDSLMVKNQTSAGVLASINRNCQACFS